MTYNVYEGDCLEILKNIPNESIDLIYLDPPFFTQKIHKLGSRKGFLEYQFSDLWDSDSDYSSFIHLRLIELFKKLRTTGSIFFHCNHDSSHIARFLLDDVFGSDMFRSEIIWYYKRWSNAQKNLLPAHQNILFYSKTNEYKFHVSLNGYSPTTNVDQILQKRKRDEHGKPVYAKDKDGEIISNGIKKGVPLSDVWEIPFLNPKAKERIGYPTQKPVLLLEKIIKLVTDEGDIVLDPFCGSGTTLVAAKLLNRKSIGIDISSDAIKLTNSRLQSPIKTESNLLLKGIESYQNVNNEILKQLEGVEIIPVQRNKGIDALLKAEFEGGPIPVKIQKPEETMSEAISCLFSTAKKKNAKIMILVKTHEDSEFNFDIEYPQELVLIDSVSVSIQKLLNRMNEKITP